MKRIYTIINIALSMLLFSTLSFGQTTTITYNTNACNMILGICSDPLGNYTLASTVSKVFYLNDFNTSNYDSFLIEQARFGITLENFTYITLFDQYTFPVRVYRLTNNYQTKTLIKSGSAIATYILLLSEQFNLNVTINEKCLANDTLLVEVDHPDMTQSELFVAHHIYNESKRTSYVASQSCAISNDLLYDVVSNLAPQLLNNCSNIGFDIELKGKFSYNPQLPGSTTFTQFQDTLCVGMNNISYSINPIQYATNYVWDYTGGGVTINGNGTNVSLSVSQNATSGYLTVKGRNQIGDGPLLSRYIHIDTGFSIRLNLNHSTICIGDSVQLIAPNGLTDYRWEPPTGLSDINSPVTWASPQNGHSYTLSAYNSAGCRGYGYTYVDVNPGPHITTSPSNLTTCGDTLNVSLSGAEFYSWSPTTGIETPNKKRTRVMPRETTKYTITAIDTMGCIRENEVVITVNHIAPIQISRNGKILTGPTGYSTYLWYKDGLPIVPNAVFPQYNAKSDGEYYLECTDANGCKTISNTIKLSGILSIDKVNWDEISIRPNPSNNNIYIDTDLDVSFEVFAIDGKKVINATQSKEINISNLANGIYYLVITDIATNSKGNFKIEKI